MGSTKCPRSDTHVDLRFKGRRELIHQYCWNVHSIAQEKDEEQ